MLLSAWPYSVQWDGASGLLIPQQITLLGWGQSIQHGRFASSPYGVSHAAYRTAPYQSTVQGSGGQIGDAGTSVGAWEQQLVSDAWTGRGTSCHAVPW